MDKQQFIKHFTDKEDGFYWLDYAYRYYLNNYKDILEYENLEMQDLLQWYRSDLQDILDVAPEIFTKDEIEKIKYVDDWILSNLDAAKRCFEPNYAEKPKIHWWWYVREIAEGKREKPDLDKIFERYLS